MARARTHAEQIAKREYDGARKHMGGGWQHLSPMLRHGLVMAGIVSVIRLQDDRNNPGLVLAYFEEMVVAAEALLDAEGTEWRL